MATPQQVAIAYRAGRLIQNICDKLPWEATCLVQSMVFVVYARYYRLPYVLCLGMAKKDDKSTSPISEPEKKIQIVGVDQGESSASDWLAHAWTLVGPVAVTGGGDLKKFRVLFRHCYRC